MQRGGCLCVRAHRALGGDGGVFVIERGRERVGIGDARVGVVADAGSLGVEIWPFMLESILRAHVGWDLEVWDDVGQSTINSLNMYLLLGSISPQIVASGLVASSAALAAALVGRDSSGRYRTLQDIGSGALGAHSAHGYACTMVSGM